jgi:cell division protein FtsL
MSAVVKPQRKATAGQPRPARPAEERLRSERQRRPRTVIVERSGSTKRAKPARGARPNRGTLAFVIVTSAVIGLMVLGLVALNAVLAQASFKIDDLQTKVAHLSQSNQDLSLEAARLASPARIAQEARNFGLTLPQEGIQVLHVPSGGPRRHHPKAVVGGRP